MAITKKLTLERIEVNINTGKVWVTYCVCPMEDETMKRSSTIEFDYAKSASIRTDAEAAAKAREGIV